MPNSAKAESIKGFILKKGQKYPKGCFDPREDMHSSFLYKRSARIKRSNGSTSGGKGRKTFAHSAVKR